MLKRLCSLFLILALLCTALPAQAETISPLTAKEIAAARAFIAMQGEGDYWQEGVAVTSNMTALQVQQYLEWLSNEIGGVMNQALDSAELLRLGGKTTLPLSLSAETQLLQTWRNRVAGYRDTLEQKRSSVYNDLLLLENTPDMSAQGRLRIAKRVRDDLSEMKAVVNDVAGNYSIYGANLAQHAYNIRYETQNADRPDDQYTSAAMEKLNAQADKLLADELAQNDVDFDVVVLSSKQFGFVVRDQDGKALKGVKAEVKCSKDTARSKTATTDAKGLVSFWTKDFLPDENNQIVVSVVLTMSGYCTREIRRLALRGGAVEPVALEKYTAKPFLRMAVFDDGDILSQKKTVFYSDKNDDVHYFEFLIDDFAAEKPSGTLHLYYQIHGEDGKKDKKEEKRSFTSGKVVIFDGDYLRRIVPGSAVSLVMETNDGQTRTFEMQLQIEEAVVEEPQFINTNSLSFTGPSLKLHFPDDIPFFGGSDLSLAVPQIPAQLYIDPSGYIKFAYGHDFSSDALNWKSDDQKKVEQRMDDWARRGERDAHAVDNQVGGDTGVKKDLNFIGATKAALNVFAGLQGRIKSDTGRISLSGSGGIQAAFSGGFGVQAFVAGFIPVFVAMDMTFGVGASFGLGLEADLPNLSNPKFQFNKGMGATLELLAELGASIGLGVRGVASLALRFFGKVIPKLKLNTKVGAAVAVAFGIEVTAQLLIAKWRQSIYEGSLSMDTETNDALQQSSASAATEYTDLPAGVNTPAAANTLLSANGDGLKADEETVVFSQLDSVSQEIQYVTLQNYEKTKSATFGFWITPTGDERQAELVWWNLDNPAKHGTFDRTDEDTYRAKSTDYAFSVMGDGMFAGVNLLSGEFNGDGNLLTSRSTIIVMRVQEEKDGSLSLSRADIFSPEKTYNTYLPGDEYSARDDDAVLSMPMIYLTQNGSQYWFLNASYAVDSASNGRTDQVISREFEYKLLKGNETLIQTPTTRINIDKTFTRRLVPSDPINVDVNGNTLVNYDKSKSCFYRLNVSKEAAQIKDEETTLTLHMNNTVKALDTGVSYFTALKEKKVWSGSNLYAFYLKKGEADDGSACNRLMGVSRTNWHVSTFVIRDYDVPIHAESFKIVSVNDGSERGIPYLYWTETVSVPDGDGTKEGYRVRCVRFDVDKNTMTAPFTLVELSEAPSSLHIQMDGTGYYTVQLPDNNASAAVSQKLVRFTFSLQTAVALNGVASYDPCVTAGEYATLLFSVKNTGNLPVSKFTVALVEKGSSQVVQTITVDCNDPQNRSENSLFDDQQYSAYSVSRVDSLYDDLNGDNWIHYTRIMSETGTSEVYEVVRTNLLMPGDVHTYRACFKVPDNWTGTKTLTAKVGQVVAINDLFDPYYPAYAFEENDTKTYESGSISVKRAGVSETQASKNIGLGRGDLMLDCQPYTDVTTGEEYVRVNIVGRSETASVVAPTLTAVLNGATVFTHTFANAIDEDFGYTLDIPAQRLLQGRDSGEVIFTVTDNQTNEDMAEFSEFDNQRTVVLGAPLRIVTQPVSAIVKEGENATFSVAASGGVLPYTYRWQRFMNGGWEDIAGAAGATLTLANVTKDDYGMTVRTIVRDSLGAWVISDEATLTVQADVPVTGDTAQPVLWGAMLSAALVLLVLLALLRRRAEKKR